MPALRVVTVPILEDNYAYLVVCESQRPARDVVVEKNRVFANDRVFLAGEVELTARLVVVQWSVDASPPLSRSLSLSEQPTVHK